MAEQAEFQFGDEVEALLVEARKRRIRGVAAVEKSIRELNSHKVSPAFRRAARDWMIEVLRFRLAAR